MGITVGILLLCALELEICLGVKYPHTHLPAKNRCRTRVKAKLHQIPFQVGLCLQTPLSVQRSRRPLAVFKEARGRERKWDLG